jgi:nitrate/nitrite-specific signal transduction histidine kinase
MSREEVMIILRDKSVLSRIAGRIVIYEEAFEDIANHIEHQTKSLKEENKELRELFNAAKKYIDESPCDPDIYPEQLKAWEEYQKLLSK